MTSVNVTTQKNTVTVQQGDATTVTVTTQGAQGATGAAGAGISAGDKGALTVAANLTDWTLNDSVVTNVKVASDAAIAGSKISPNFGSQNITTTGNAVFGGNLTVSGTTTTIDTTTLTVEDKNIELGKVGSPTDITADEGGISLLGDTTKTFQWLNATDSWTSSEHIALPDNKKLQLGTGQDVQVYWDGSAGFVTNQGGGNLHFNSDTVLIKNAANTKSHIRAYNNSSVELYHNNVKKAETSADGFLIQGNAVVDQVQIQGSSPRLEFNQDDHNTSFRINSGGGTLQLQVSTNNGASFANAIGIGGVGNIFIPDNDKVNFGSLNDLTIVHDGTDSKITNKTGNLLIEAKDTETGIKVIPDDGIELYFDAVKKLSTRSFGCTVHGTLQANTNLKVNSYTGQLLVGVSNEFSIQHDDTDTFIENTVGNLHIRPKSSEEGIKLIPDGAVELYHDGVKRCETSANGFDLPDNSKLQLGDSQDLAIFHDGSNSVIKDAGTGMLKLLASTMQIRNSADSKTMAQFLPNGAATFFYDGAKKFETTADGTKISKEIQIEGVTVNAFESGRIRFTETNSDFNGGYIHYDGSANILKLGVHPFNDAVVGNDVDCIEMKRTAGSENVELNFAGSKKCETTSSGITVQGSVTTEDMNMSNLNGTANEVDGSKGSWSIQEGADDLFIINRVSGKKYKFNLTEIS